MNTEKILTELHAEREKLDAAIAALEAVNSTVPRGPGRPRTAVAGSRRGRLSAAARRKLSRLLKQRWAQGKMKPGTKRHAGPVSRSPRRMSRAGRARIAAAQRARWARARARHPQAQVA